MVDIFPGQAFKAGNANETSAGCWRGFPTQNVPVILHWPPLMLTTWSPLQTPGPPSFPLQPDLTFQPLNPQPQAPSDHLSFHLEPPSTLNPQPFRDRTSPTTRLAHTWPETLGVNTALPPWPIGFRHCYGCALALSQTRKPVEPCESSGECNTKRLMYVNVIFAYLNPNQHHVIIIMRRNND